MFLFIRVKECLNNPVYLTPVRRLNLPRKCKITLFDINPDSKFQIFNESDSITEENQVKLFECNIVLKGL